MKKHVIPMIIALLSGPAFADGHLSSKGDPVAGEVQFNRQCQACHVVRDGDGDTLAGRNARTGPNLYGIAGRTIGSVDGFRYGKSIVQAGEAGAVWTEDVFVGYVQDPTGWLREQLDDRRARGKMAYQVRTEKDAFDLYAYLSSVTAQ